MTDLPRGLGPGLGYRHPKVDTMWHQMNWYINPLKMKGKVYQYRVMARYMCPLGGERDRELTFKGQLNLVATCVQSSSDAIMVMSRE